VVCEPQITLEPYNGNILFFGFAVVHLLAVLLVQQFLDFFPVGKKRWKVTC
jgi:hypothetical protein